jgi:hypothetical protein
MKEGRVALTEFDLTSASINDPEMNQQAQWLRVANRILDRPKLLDIVLGVGDSCLFSGLFLLLPPAALLKPILSSLFFQSDDWGQCFQSRKF